MSEIVFDTVAWMIRPQEATSGSRVRFLADAPDSELFFLASLAKRDSIILSDSPVHMWSSELANPNGFELGVLEYLR